MILEQLLVSDFPFLLLVISNEHDSIQTEQNLDNHEYFCLLNMHVSVLACEHKSVFVCTCYKYSSAWAGFY